MSRETVRAFVTQNWVERTITGLIVVNAITLGLETSDEVMATWGPVLRTIDMVILAIFVVEIIARMYAHGAAFFRDPWSIFDFLVVGIALLPATGNLAVLRSLRILRALRLISAVPSMRRVVSGLLRAIPGMGSVTMLLLLILYVSAVMATSLFGDDFPEFFGSLGASSFSLFQIMTLEGWPDIARSVIEKHPHAWIFFVVYILLTSFAVLNLFIGIIVDAMQAEQPSAEELASDVAEQTEDELSSILNRLDDLSADMAELRAAVDRTRG
ncbi:MAG: ion transporter [Pseudomonadota bacterium]